MNEKAENKSSSSSRSRVYNAPTWEVFVISKGLPLLESFSMEMEGDIEDILDGDDF